MPRDLNYSAKQDWQSNESSDHMLEMYTNGQVQSHLQLAIFGDY